MNRKIALGEWFDPMFRLLKGSRRLRGTALDPFGRAEVRRVERALPGEYRDLIDRVLPYLASDYTAAVELLEAPAVIRGYEQVKLGNVAVFRQRVRAQLEALGEVETTGAHPHELPAH
jgi:indolepyruvate ferredoxin oxidoreductase